MSYVNPIDLNIEYRAICRADIWPLASAGRIGWNRGS
jgi:hypothetical protein